MRPLEFRGKRIDNGEWVEGSLVGNKRPMIIGTHLLVDDDSGRKVIEMQATDIWQIDPDTIGQYVLTDAYGEKVFEGDICRDTNEKQRVFEIVYQDFSFSVSVEGYRDLFELYERGRIEKIGNKFDNPELHY